MALHIDYQAVSPASLQALLAFSKEANGEGIEPVLRHLIDVRASQINGCAYCLDMHCREAKHAGETERRLNAVAVWRETPFFTPAERAALELTERVTKLPEGPIPDEIYSELRKHFSETQIVQILMKIVCINMWNRMGVGSGMQPK